MPANPNDGAGLDVPEAAAEHEPERAPLLLAQYPARIYAAGNAQGRPPRGAAVLPRGASGQLLAAPEDRPSQAVTCLVIAVILSRDQSQRAELAVQLGQLLDEEARLTVATQRLQARKARIYWSGLQAQDAGDPLGGSDYP